MSDMSKDTLQYVVGLSEPHVVEFGGQSYIDKSMTKLESEPLARPIEMSTLTSLVDYIKGHIDSMDGKMIIQVTDPGTVNLFSQLKSDRRREYLVEVNAKIPSFGFNQYSDRESFGIALQSKFISDNATDKDLLLAFIGNVEDGTVSNYGDDGVTQKATVKTGIASKSDAKVPNPVKLMPYRTFIEVNQPISEFIFRMKSDRGVTCAIYEADGGAWVNEATENIKKYLQWELKGLEEQFTVIS